MHIYVHASHIKCIKSKNNFLKKLKTNTKSYANQFIFCQLAERTGYKKVHSIINA